MTIGNRSFVHVFIRVFYSLAVIVLADVTLHAQTGVKGRVLDSSNNPIPGAFVSLYEGEVVRGYAISGSEGEFQIVNGNYKPDCRLIVTCLGYKKEEMTLETFLKSGVVRMVQQSLSIKESTVTAGVVEQKGDTVSYMAGAFKDGTERSLGDLLGKLPGITVSSTGGIYHNGRAINKFYVEGMDLMGSGYGVVTKNLSPDVVAEVEILQRHQPIRALIGLSQTDRSAVNIVLKEGARNTWMFNADAVAGAPHFPLFDASTLLTRFAKETQDLYLLKGNDIGIDIKGELAQQSYFGKTGAFIASSDGYDSDFAGRLRLSRTVLPVPREYWYDNLSGIGSFNHLRKVNDDVIARVSFGLASERYGESSLSSEVISFADGEILSIDERKNMTELSHFLRGKAVAEQNSSNVYLSDELSFEGLLRSAESVLDSRESEFDQNLTLPSMKVENVLDVKRRTKSGRAISFSSATKYVRNNHSAHYVGESMDMLQKYGQSYIDSENDFSSSYRINRMTLNYLVGANMQYMGMRSELSGDSFIPAINETVMDVVSVTPKVRVSGRFSLKGVESVVSLPLYLQAILPGHGGGSLEVHPAFTPSVLLTRNFTQSLKMRAESSYSLSRSGLESLLPAPVMTNYRTLSESDSLALHESFRIFSDIEYSDVVNLFFANLSASLFTTASDKMSVASYTDKYTFIGFTAAPVSTKSYSVNGKLTKYFGAKSFVTELSGGWSRADQSHYLQEVLCAYTTDSYSSELNMRMAPVQWFSAEAKVRYVYSRIAGNASADSQSLTVNGMLMVKPHKDVMLKADADWMKEQVPGIVSSNIPLLKAELSWKLSKMSIVASCRNLLDVDEFRRQYVTDYKTTSFTVNLPGRQYLLGFRMSL